MNSSQVTSKGVHEDIINSNSIDADTLKVLKTQDLGYIIHKKAIDDRKIDKLKNSLHIIGHVKPSIHKHFEYEDLENLESTTKNTSASFNSLRKKEILKINKLNESSYKELDRRIKRSTKLKKAIDALQLQRSLTGKGSKRKIVTGTGTNAVVQYKWKKQRTR
jgi:U3 small nucleolar RNA-associated protein 11